MCLISSSVCVVPGATILAMGAVVVGKLPSAKATYAGVPAKLIKTGIEGGAYFRRRRGVVGLDEPGGPANAGSPA